MQRFAFILFAFVFCTQIASAQTDPSLVGNCETGKAEACLDVGNVRARLLNTGNLFYRGSPAVYEVPKGSGIHSIFSSSLHIGGLENDELVEAKAQIADVYAKDGADFAKLRLTSGSEVVVRLDRLLSVNGFDLPTAC